MSQKILGITYFNFKDKATGRINKGVNVHQAKPVLDTMGAGLQSDKVKFPIDKFNELFNLSLPIVDESVLTSAHIGELAKLIGRECSILLDTRQVPALVQFPKV